MTQKIFILLMINFTISLLFPYSSRAQGIEIPSGGTLTANGTAFISIENGDLVNNGSYIKGTETIIMSGNIAKSISGSSNTDMNNLSIVNTGGITTQLNLLIANNLTIASGCKFNIESDKDVTITSNLINNSGSEGGLSINSTVTGTGSLIHNSNDVPASVKRYIDGTASAWHFLSSPVSNQNINGDWKPSGTYGDGTGYDLYVWDEAHSCWIYNLNTTVMPTWSNVHPQTDFVPGRGYLYSVQETTPTKQFAGNLGNGTITNDLTIDATGGYKGFSLIGNPYPSSIDWKIETGFNREMLYQNGGGYDIWTWSSTADNYGVYNSADTDDNGTNNVSRYIAPMQAFFVHANSAGSFEFNNQARVHNGASRWMKVRAEKNVNNNVRLTVNLETGKGSDEVKLNFGFTANENGAKKMFSNVLSAPSLFLPVGNQPCSIRYLTDTIENRTIPLSFKAGINGNYTLKCVYDESVLGTIYLEDNLTGTMTNFRDFTQYGFAATKNDTPERFTLHFGSIEQTGNDINARVYVASQSLIIDMEGLKGEYEARIMDISGRQINQSSIIGGQRIAYPLKIRAVYLVNIQSKTAKKIYKVVF